MNATMRTFLSPSNAPFEGFSGIAGTGLSVMRRASELPANSNSAAREPNPTAMIADIAIVKTDRNTDAPLGVVDSERPVRDDRYCGKTPYGTGSDGSK